MDPFAKAPIGLEDLILWVQTLNGLPVALVVLIAYACERSGAVPAVCPLACLIAVPVIAVLLQHFLGWFPGYDPAALFLVMALAGAVGGHYARMILARFLLRRGV